MYTISAKTGTINDNSKKKKFKRQQTKMNKN